MLFMFSKNLLFYGKCNSYLVYYQCFVFFISESVVFLLKVRNFYMNATANLAINLMRFPIFKTSI